MPHPTDDQLREWKKPSEDHFIERKSSGDHRDWLKTIVAFANSTPPDRFAVLYIGVRDDGSVEDTVNLDSLQKTLNGRLADAYPRIEYTTRVLVEGDRHYLCVIVRESSNRPHFAGPAYVRVGSQTVNASPQQFDSLVAQRNSKTHLLLKFKDKTVTALNIRGGEAALRLGRISGQTLMRVIDCNQFNATLSDQYGTRHQVSLDRIQILHDTVYNVITLEIRQD